MALHTELPVYRDTYKLVLEVFVSTKNFPKEYKYSLGRDMERDVLVLMRCIYKANRAQEKTTFLNEFLDNFEILKLEIRVCVDLKLVSIKRQSVLAALMISIGKQVVGWRNSTTTNARIV
tara:strand:+ start:88 stop:447 length:360 start_codon:yes stop_codon:yes gene_type:complete